MCGRFYIDGKTEKEIWNIVRDVDRRLRLPAVGDIRPSESSVIIRGSNKQGLNAEVMRWGYKQISGSGLIINARAESAIDKPLFRDSILQRRCVIPASGFYEWNRQKEKVTFKRTDDAVLYMAGFYQRYEQGNRFVILTTGANDSMKPIHDRMPVVLEKAEMEDWIYNTAFMEYALKRIPVELTREQEYEQQSFIF